MLHNNIKANYAGIEIIDEMIDFSKSRFPNINITNQNILCSDFTTKYDILVFSGGLYFRGNIIEKEWREFVYAMINKMYNQSNIGISFNLLTTYKNKHNDQLFYLDPKEIIDYTANNLSRYFNLSHCYPLYEWTISILNLDYIKSTHNLPEYDKY
jgi:hypothetical protein